MSPLILSHDLRVDGIGVSDSVRSFAIQAKADEIVIPSTAGSLARSVAAGAEEFFVTISYLQSESAGSLNEILWTVFLTDPDKIVSFSGKMTDNSMHRYSGFLCVTDVTTGGEVHTLQENSVTYRMTGRPTIAASAS